MAVLDAILSAKREAIVELRARPLPSPPPRRPVRLERAPHTPLNLITEIKRRSPSAGALSTRMSAGERAAAYERGGAVLISVLTDTPFFDGRYEDLQAAREACQLPLLCKDFVIDECQLDAARAFGADAVLLIVRCLERAQLSRLHAAAKARELVPLVEVTTEEETKTALDAGAELIGVNARDLDTLKMDGASTARVLAAIPTGVRRVRFSGITTPANAAEVAASGVDAALIGEVLMREDDPEPLLRRLCEAAR